MSVAVVVVNSTPPATVLVGAATPLVPSASITDYQLQAWAQPTWDIDPVNGDEANTGLLGFPIKTCAEQHRRVGPIHEIEGTMSSRTPKVKMYIRSSLLATDVLTLRLLVKPPASAFQGNDKVPYQVIGSLPTPVASGTITSVRAFDNTTGTGTPWGMQTSLGAMATHVRAGRIAIRTNITDANSPLSWWIAKDEDGVTSRLSYPTYFTPASDLVNGNTSPSPTFQAGDTFSLYDLPVIPRCYVDVQSVNQFALLLNRLNVTPPNVEGTGAFAATECAFPRFQWMCGAVSATNCQYTGIWTIGQGARFYGTYGLFLNTLRIMAGHPTFQNYVMFQGGSRIQSEGGVTVHCHTRGFQVFDQTGDGWTVDPGDQLIYAGGMIGYGNSGYGIRVMRGGKCTVGGLGATGGRFFRLTGTLGDICIGGRTSGPALNTTTPYGWTADRSYTHDLFNTTVAGGGFGQSIFDPTCPGSGIILEG